MKNYKTAAAYIRVSTDGQLDLSPDSQLDEVKAFAKKNNIYLLDEYIFREMEGVSGKRAANREAFQRMIAIAKTKPKPFDCIIVWKFSRFARNQDESTFYKGMLRKKFDIDVLSVSEPVLDGMYGRLIEMIIEWQDEFYSYNLAGEVRRGMKKRIENGLPVAQPPYGYDFVTGGTPVINEEQASIVRLSFQMYTTGTDINGICQYLNQKGIRTKRNNKWTAESVTYMIENPYYVGKLRWNRRQDSSSQKLNDEKEWIYSDGVHEPIISNETFDLAQEKRKRSIALHTRYAHPVSHTTHWLSGLVKCSICGKTLSVKHEAQALGFQCCGYRNGLHPESQYISERKLVSAVMESLNSVLLDESVPYELIHSLPDADQETLGMFQFELSRMSGKEERIKKAYLNGIDTMDEYRKNKEELKQRREELESFIQSHTNVTDSSTDNVLKSNVENVIEVLNSDAPNSKKAESIRSCVQYMTFYKKEKRLEVHYYAVC